ncbi:MAG: murein hydrolase activator EnvC family protein [Pseudomonadales bacterium]
MGRLLTGTLLLGCLWAHSAAAAPADPSERAATKAALERITKQLNDLDAWLGGVERKRTQWQREIQTSDREVARLSREVDAAAAAAAAVQLEIGTLRDEQASLQAQRLAQARHVGEHLNSAQRMEGEDFIKLLLNQQSPESFDRMVRYHRYFTAARLEALQQYRGTLARLEANQAQLQTRAAEAERRQQTLQREQAALVTRRDERKTLLARLDSEAEDKAAERKRLSADRERVETLLAEIERRSQALDGRTFAARKGALPWPLTGRVVHAFGQPRADGRMTWHGLMVEAQEGAAITAVHRGRVVFADWLRGFGLLTIIDHGSGYMTLYGHADVLGKQVGDWVESGEIIARAGRSGGVTTAGLYFEVRHQGRATDPIGWLAKR